MKYTVLYTSEIYLSFSRIIFKKLQNCKLIIERVIKILHGNLIYSVSNAPRGYARQSEIYGIADSLNKRISTGATRNDQNHTTRVFYINAGVINAPTSLFHALAISEM